MRGPVERQELLRKHRKLAQVFGEGVGGILWPTDDPPAVRARGGSPGSHRKGALSTGAEEDRTQVMIIGPLRRHSTPSSAEFGGEYAVRGSHESFMELSDQEEERMRAAGEGEVNPDERAEQERKKMRDKLAKLHRFLGSRVPVELALGAGYALGEADLPQPAPRVGAANAKDGRKAWIRRRRSSSSAVLPGYSGSAGAGAHSVGRSSSSPPPALEERMKDELGDKERARNLKRANKMEQVRRVGVACECAQCLPRP